MLLNPELEGTWRSPPSVLQVGTLGQGQGRKPATQTDEVLVEPGLAPGHTLRCVLSAWLGHKGPQSCSAGDPGQRMTPASEPLQRPGDSGRTREPRTE